MGESGAAEGMGGASLDEERSFAHCRGEWVGEVHDDAGGKPGTRVEAQFHPETFAGARPSRQIACDRESLEMTRGEEAADRDKSQRRQSRGKDGAGEHHQSRRNRHHREHADDESGLRGAGR